MIDEKDKKTIEKIARKYRASRLLLFRSSIQDTPESQDIDIAVEGIDDKDFYAFYGELIYSLSKPVDVVDLSRKSKFIDLILKEGVPIYA
jgi:uncharacterized protein